MHNTTWSTKHKVKYKTQREVQNTTGSTKHNVKYEQLREVTKHNAKYKHSIISYYIKCRFTTWRTFLQVPF